MTNLYICLDQTDGTNGVHLFVWETESQQDVEHMARCTLCYGKPAQHFLLDRCLQNRMVQPRAVGQICSADVYLFGMCSILESGNFLLILDYEFFLGSWTSLENHRCWIPTQSQSAGAKLCLSPFEGASVCQHPAVPFPPYCLTADLLCLFTCPARFLQMAGLVFLPQAFQCEVQTTELSQESGFQAWNCH